MSNATLMAEGDVVLQSQAQMAEQHSTERSSSAGVGLALTYGQGGWAAGFTANASAARGNADGQDLTHRHTQVNAGQGATLVSGGNTTLSGAQVSAEQVTARVGGDLTIHSVQDTATYDSQHRSAGGSVTIGYGFAASASYSNARVEADHASVSQHSGLRAGDQGFQVEVKGHTELQGGLIASTQAAVDEGRNRLATGTLSTQDITNRSEHDARGISLSGGFSYGGSGKQGSSDGAGTNSPGSTSAPASPSSGVALQQFQTGSQGVAAGYVSDSSHRSSTTRSGISGGELVITDEAGQIERTGQSIEETLASVNRNVLSGTGANELTQRWDGQQLQQQVQAGAQIVATFGQQASKAVGDYAGKRADELRAQGQEEEARKWDEGGAYRVAAHLAVGGLSGGLEGALGSGSSAAAADALNELTADLPQGVRQAVGAGIAAGLGALTGGPTGAATAFNADVNNRQLHPSEKQWIKDNAKRFAQQHGISEQEAEQRLAQQAFRQVQFGVEGAEDAQARAFLGQAHGMLTADPGCPTCGPGYMFYATPEQRANAGMYAGTLPQTAEFYQSNKLTQPTLEQIVTAATTDSAQRNRIAQQTVLAAVAAGTLALAPSLSGVATEAAAFARNPVGYCLGNPAACTVAAETAAYTAAGVPQPGSGVPAKVGTAPAGARGTGAVADTSAGKLVSDLGPNYSVIAPRGVGAAEGSLPAGYTTVSRWVSPEEAAQWIKNQGAAIPAGVGTPLPGTSTTTVYVTTPGAAKPGGTGPIRIDFAVPEKALNPAGNSQWSQIYQPSQSTPLYNVRINIPDGVIIPGGLK